jgi:large subunit ribosomal protein L26e|tara:strand:- start:1343 stop:1495 length:153 start_codon:yes stop_codon:yes gene_type:complete
MLLKQITGASVQVGIDPSKCVITKLKMDKSRKAILARKGSAATEDAEMAD